MTSIQPVRSPSTSSVAVAPASTYAEPGSTITGLPPIMVITGGVVSGSRVASIPVESPTVSSVSSVAGSSSAASSFSWPSSPSWLSSLSEDSSVVSVVVSAVSTVASDCSLSCMPCNSDPSCTSPKAKLQGTDQKNIIITVRKTTNLAVVFLFK